MSGNVGYQRFVIHIVVYVGQQGTANATRKLIATGAKTLIAKMKWVLDMSVSTVCPMSQAK